MIKIITFLLIVTTALTSYAQDLAGDWKGNLSFQGMSLDVAFHIQEGVDKLTSTMDIPSQGLMDGEAATTLFKNDTLTISFPTFRIQYKGVPANDSIMGHLIQNNFPVPLNLTRGIIELKRPQQPKAPFNYTSRDITFNNKEDNISLSGTLTIPNDVKNPPVAVIISGSGPQNRDGDMFGHQLYYVLADHLSSNGIAVLRYDERGVGTSTGTFKTAGIDEFSRDAMAAIAYLKKRKALKKSKIGLIGHSIGGIIAPKIASENEDVDFTIMLAGPGVPGDDLMLSQKAAMERLMNVPEAQITQGQELLGLAYKVIINTTGNNETIKEKVNTTLSNKLGPLAPKAQIEAITNQITTPEVISLLKATPAAYLSSIKTPILAMNGKKDFQVPYEANLEAIKKAFAAGTNENTRTVALEGLNHLFQESTTGALSEYSEIEQTMAPKALKFITKWIKENTAN